MRWSFLRRVAVMAVAHVVLLAVLHVMLETFEPEPNGFRFDSLSKALSFGFWILPPAVVGLWAVRKRTVLVLASAHALSPLLLMGTMRDPNEDLNFAALLWWIPLPMVFAAIVLVDRLRPPSSD